LEALVDLITSPNGSLAYHLVIAFTLLGALQSVLNQTDERAAEARGRMALGLGALLAMRGVLFLASGLAIQGFSSAALLLPVIDRVLGLLSVLGLIWLWSFHRPNRTGDAATLLAGAAVALAGALSGLYWAANGQPGTLNESGLSLFWEGLAVVLIIGGELVVVTRRPEHWGTGLTMLLLLFGGALIQLVAPNVDSDVPAYIRLAQLAAFPLLFTLPRSLVLPPAPASAAEPETRPAREEAPAETARAKTAEKTQQGPTEAGLPVGELRAIMELAATDKPEDVCRLLTRQLGRALVADITLLLTPPDHTGQVVVMCGYDLIREDTIGGAMLDQRIIPGYPEAMQRGRPLQIPDSDKLDPLAKSLSIKQTGHLLVLPLANDERKPLAAIVLFSPYSKRMWTAQDQRYVKEAAPLISQLLQKTQRGLRMRENLLASESQLREAMEERERLAEEQRATLAELDVLRAELENAGKTGEAAAMREELEALRAQAAAGAGAAGAAAAAAQEFEALASENARMKKEFEAFERLKRAAQAAAAERDRLRTEMEALRQRAAPASPSGEAEPGLSGEQAEVIASIAQDLRQPMSSIVGYTDLLLSESVGILGALQRKFLDRVKASTERMNSLVDNLIQITALDSGNVHITPETVDLAAVIDHSIGETSGQMREKNIALRVDLADDLPRMHTDKDAVQQILTHLLSNAGAATPVEGEIALRARADRKNGGPPSVLVEVADSGEGIPEEDMPRVFSRLYRADNPLIQGVGDTGVGLSIAKTLAEALGGEIWVESQLGKGSTFRVRLPLETRPGNGQPGGAPE
jgi:signal transduction histidine kinase